MPTSASIPKPEPFFTLRCHDVGLSPTLCGLCVGYENGVWRHSQLADYIVKWLPEFALKPSEWASLNHANAVELIRKAAQIVYQTHKFKQRGEFGELFLHAVIRQVHDSLPAISKIYYKSAANDTVKGFDAVHVVGPHDSMELWLGEAKFYVDANAAIRDVTQELQDHLKTDYLRGEFILIGNKLDEHLPHTPVLKRLLAHETSLDEVFTRVCIPILLTYDSDCVSAHTFASTDYSSHFEKELRANYSKFVSVMAGKTVPKEVRIHLFLMPMHKKTDLVNALDRKLKTWQQL